MDLATYLAKGTSMHIQRRVKGATFRGGAFEYDSNFPNQLTAPNNYRLYFVDKGTSLNILVDNNGGDTSTLKASLHGNIHLKERYKDIISKTMVDIQEGSLVVTMDFAMSDLTNRRSTNRRRIFNAVFHSGLKQVLERILLNPDVT